MASSKKPPSSNSSCSAADSRLVKHLEGMLSPLVRPHQKLLIALSGGLDSRVLLELLVLLKPMLQYELQAMHVHHGLSPNADQWADFCLQTCNALSVPLEVVRVQVPKDIGLGTEAAARKARYAALNAADVDFILLAHHEDDQAETLLLQMLRGAGIKGMSAMGEHDAKQRYLRPLLKVPRAELHDFAVSHSLQWIEDESNTDTGYDRNYCRHHILPVIEQRFPAARHTLARSAGHMAEAAQLLDELAELDARQYVQSGKLGIDGLRKLSEPRARNLLRWWLSNQNQSMPSTLRLNEMLRQLLHAKADARVRIALGRNFWLRRYRDQAYVETEQPFESPIMMWQGEPELEMPDGSRLLFEEKPGEGLACQRLGIDRLRIAYRQGGERLRLQASRPTRTLKYLFQESGIPPSQRDRIPLLYHGDVLAVVPGIGTAARLQTAGDEAGLVVTWRQN